MKNSKTNIFFKKNYKKKKKSAIFDIGIFSAIRYFEVHFKVEQEKKLYSHTYSNKNNLLFTSKVHKNYNSEKVRSFFFPFKLLFLIQQVSVQRIHTTHTQSVKYKKKKKLVCSEK